MQIGSNILLGLLLAYPWSAKLTAITGWQRRTASAAEAGQAPEFGRQWQSSLSMINDMSRQIGQKTKFGKRVYDAVVVPTEPR